MRLCNKAPLIRVCADFKAQNGVARGPLTPEQLQHMHENGYIVVRGLFDRTTLERYRHRFQQLCDGTLGKDSLLVVKDYALCKNGAHPEHYINKIQELLFDEVYSTYSENPQLLDMMTQLLGPDVTAVHCMLINKPPGSTHHPPHQDLPYLPIVPENKIICAWTAIDAVSKENGSLFMIPGSHRYPVLIHSDQSNDTKGFYQGIVNCEAIAEESRRVYLPMEPGDTVLFYPGIVHGSLANTSDMCRKAIMCHYASSKCTYASIPGSRYENMARMMEAKLRSYGSDLTFTDMWRLKTKQMRGVRCNL